MATNLPFSLHPGQEDRILYFLNRISSPADITDNRLLKDDPYYNGTGGYTIGDTVATRIINAKSTLPGGRFRNLDQILAVEGMGPDKLSDLLASFWQPAAEFFHDKLKSGILFDNWKVEHWTYDFSDKVEAFKNLTQHECLIKNFVAEQVRDIIFKKHNQNTLASLCRSLIQHLPVDYTPEDALTNSHLFAIWWYRFDADNWFSFERIREACEAYLSYYTRYPIDLFMIKDFQNGGTLAEAISPNGLPVVINHGEHNITIWAASLFD